MNPADAWPTPRDAPLVPTSDRVLTDVRVHEYWRGPCWFPASDAAAMVTGRVLYVDGGYTAQ